MLTYYTRRAYEILQNDGVFELFKRTKNLLLWSVISNNKKRLKYESYKNYLNNVVKYDCPAKPFQCICIDPSQINYKYKRKNNHGDIVVPKPLKGLGWVLDGNWDKHRYDIQENPTIKGFMQRFEKGWKWKETDYYKTVHDICKEDGRHKQYGYKDLEDYLSDRCGRYEELFNDIEKNGYISGHSGKRMDPISTQSTTSNLEVLVTIDRKGNFYQYDGNHRLAIARILDINIPVHVLGRHKQWQGIRDDIYNNGFSKEYEGLRNHPDLQDILEDTA